MEEKEKMKKIEILDTTLRDGEQATSGFKYGARSKLELAHVLAGLNVDTIEAGNPISSQEEFEAVRIIAEEIDGPYICALARMVDKDIDRAWEAIQFNPKPLLHVYTIPVNKDAIESYDKPFEEVLTNSVQKIERAYDYIKGTNGRIEFTAQNVIFAVLEALQNNDDRALSHITQMYDEAIKVGAYVINFPDTEGRVLPFQTETAIKYLRENIPSIGKAMMSVHCHNDLGCATANSMAAIREGVGQIEVTINGIGERAGNAALEEVVMNIHAHSESLDVCSDVDTTQLNKASRLVSDHNGWEVQPNKAIVGSNSFKHSSGVHQDGNIKGRGKGKLVYQIFNQDLVGWTEESNQLTARSGKSGVWERITRLGYDINVEEVEEDIMPKFKSLADEKGLIDDIDLRVMMDRHYQQNKETVSYREIEIYKGKGNQHYHASVDVIVNGKEISSETVKGTGEKINGLGKVDSLGAIDALFSAVDSVVPIQDDERPVLVLYDPKNIGKDHSATAEVTVILSENGYEGNVSIDQPVYIGRARHKDTLRASVEAYIDALNSYLKKQ
jgi:2-isopropylmalate synthase